MGLAIFWRKSDNSWRGSVPLGMAFPLLSSPFLSFPFLSFLSWGSGLFNRSLDLEANSSEI
jgi:hypothetical protein